MRWISVAVRLYLYFMSDRVAYLAFFFTHIEGHAESLLVAALSGLKIWVILIDSYLESAQLCLEVLFLVQ